MKLIKGTVVLMLLLVMGVSISSAQEFAPGSILEQIQTNGVLRCGVNPGLVGFAQQDAEGQYQGFDVDVCRAVAAAILGDADAIEYVPLTAAERPVALQLGAIDMLSRNTTWTLSRNTEWNAIFAPTTFYDGQSLMVRRDSNITSLPGLTNAAICVAQGTTTELNLRDTLAALDINFELVSTADTQVAFESFMAGDCDAFSTDKSGLAAYRADMANIGENANDFFILESTISKEPLGPVSPSRDPEFAEVITWVVYGLFAAEEFGITSDNVEAIYNDPTNPEIERFLGVGGTTTGDRLSIPNDFMYQVILQVGNYEEIFNRHLGPATPLGLDRGLNRLYLDGGFALLTTLPLKSKSVFNTGARC